MDSAHKAGSSKETPYEIDLNWKQLVNKEYRQAGQWDSLWSNVFFDKEVEDSQEQRNKVIQNKIAELEKKLQKNIEETKTIASMRTTMSSHHRGLPTLEKYDYGKYNLSESKDLMAAYTKSYREKLQ